MATEALQSRRSLAVLLVQAFYGSLIGAYFVAVLLRVKSLSFGDNQFQSASGTFLLMLPLSLLFSAAYVVLSLQIARIKDSERTSFFSFETERVLGHEDSDDDAAIMDKVVRQSLEEFSTRQSGLDLDELTLCGDFQHGLFNAEVAVSCSCAEDYVSDAGDDNAPYGFVDAVCVGSVQEDESCVPRALHVAACASSSASSDSRAVPPDPLQSLEPATPKIVGLSEAIAASRAGSVEKVRLEL